MIREKCALTDIREVLIFASYALTSGKCAQVLEKCALVFKKSAMINRKYTLQIPELQSEPSGPLYTSPKWYHKLKYTQTWTTTISLEKNAPVFAVNLQIHRQQIMLLFSW